MSVIQRQRNQLLRLQAADPQERRLIIDRLPEEAIEATTHLARMLVNRDIPILRRDRSKFREEALALRQLASAMISLRRKRTTLASHLSLVPFILRPFYLTCDIIRDADE